MCEKEPKRRSCTTCPQYDGAVCQATGFQLGDKETVLASENRRGFICVDTGEGTPHNAFVMTTRIVDSDSDAKSVDYPKDNPNQSENQQWYTVEARANIGVDLDLLREHNPNIKVIRASELEAGSPSSECPSRREGPPQKGKIAESKAAHNSQRLSVTLSPEACCITYSKSHTDGDRLVCDRWGLQDILMPYRPCEKWARNMRASLSTDKDKSAQTTDALKVSLLYNKDQSLKHVEIVPEQEWRELEQSSNGAFYEGKGLQYVENPPPIWKRDPVGLWEPVRPRSCTNCKWYNDPICMQMASRIGKTEELREREEKEGFKCYAVLPKEEHDAVITSNGCNSGKELR